MMGHLQDFSSLHDPPARASSLERPNPVSINDAAALQKDLDLLITWSTEWQLKFNPDRLMHIGHQYKTNYTIRQD